MDDDRPDAKVVSLLHVTCSLQRATSLLLLLLPAALGGGEGAEGEGGGWGEKPVPKIVNMAPVVACVLDGSMRAIEGGT